MSLGRHAAIAAGSALLIACAAAPASKAPATPSAVPADAMDAPAFSGQEPRGPAAAGRARAELERAEAELASASNDCSVACRALGSMERATAHLCQIAASPEDQRACEDARARLESSRAKVTRACGECAR